MSAKKIELSSLEGLSADNLAVELNTLINASFEPPNGSLKYVEDRVRHFENKYKMTSEEMMNAVASGSLPETEAFATWAINYSLLKELSAN